MRHRICGDILTGIGNSESIEPDNNVELKDKENKEALLGYLLLGCLGDAIEKDSEGEE